MKKEIIWIHVLAFLLIIAIMPVVWYSGFKYSSIVAISPPLEVRINTTPQYSLIDPLIFTDTDQRLFPEYNPLDASIEKYINNGLLDGKVSSASVYFRDLNTGHWTGVNTDEAYEPSSMLKVIVMIAYLRDAIQNPSILSKIIYYSGADQSGQYYTASSTLSAGNYTVQKLIDTMIINSDNSAALTLISNNKNAFDSVYSDFQLPPTPQGTIDDYMTVKEYATIFRTLYNASYLTRNLSDQALRLMTQTNFNKGIVVGVPSGVLISHKFGEHTFVNTNGITLGLELHDCGIVYHPGHPYLICIMTKGNNFTDLEKVISDISSMVYKYTNKHSND